MMAKYCHKVSPLKARASGRHSPTWKRLLKVRHQAHPYVRWVVGQGNIYFWDDIWMEDSTLRELCIDDRGSPLTKVSDFIREGSWDEAKLQLLQTQAGLPHQVIDHILDTPIVSREPDIPRWALSRMGEFSLATTWETIRSQRPVIPGLEDIWKAGLTTSIAIFNWRLLSNRIPVDTKLQWRGIEMASKCQCCPNGPSVESMQHLFIQGRGATSIWREFDGWFVGSSPPIRLNDTIPDRIDVWSRRTQQHDKKHLCHAMPYLIMWFIWAERNRSRHDQVPFKPYNVIWQVQTFIRNSMAIGTIKPKHWKGMQLKMSVPNQAESRRPRPLAMQVKWHPPDEPWIKINTDGAVSLTMGKAGGGGVIRDHSGKVLAALQLHLMHNRPLRPSSWPSITASSWLRSSIGPCGLNRTPNKQSNSSMAQHGAGNIRRIMARLVILKQQYHIRASFIYREGNRAADWLAKLGLDQPSFRNITEQEIPTMLKAIVRMDQMGIPNIRVRNEDNE